MKIYKLSPWVLCILLLSYPFKANCQQTQEVSNLTASDTNIIADGAMPILISKQFSFTEGPAVDKKGNIFFTDQPDNKIWKYGTDGKLTLFLDSAGRSNGLYFDKKGNIIACADEHNQLWSINKKGKVTVLLKDLNGKNFNGPNDLWIDPAGGIYFTDPYYQRSYWTRKQPEIQGQKVYYLAKNASTAVPVLDTLKQPNGIVGSPDGKFLYVADIRGRKTYKYTINPDGSVTDARLLFEMGSDGMTLDNRGNIYITGNGVTVFNPQGQKLKHIAIPEKWSANVAFGGKKRDKLFITSSQAIYVLDMKVKGVE